MNTSYAYTVSTYSYEINVLNKTRQTYGRQIVHSELVGEESASPQVGHLQCQCQTERVALSAHEAHLVVNADCVSEIMKSLTTLITAL